MTKRKATGAKAAQARATLSTARKELVAHIAKLEREVARLRTETQRLDQKCAENANSYDALLGSYHELEEERDAANALLERHMRYTVEDRDDLLDETKAHLAGRTAVAPELTQLRCLRDAIEQAIDEWDPSGGTAADIVDEIISILRRGPRDTPRGIEVARRAELLGKLRDANALLDEWLTVDGAASNTPKRLLDRVHAHLAGQPAARCPTCNSPAAHLHPAMQHEGEAQLCSDPWHASTERGRLYVAGQTAAPEPHTCWRDPDPSFCKPCKEAQP